ncbi:cytochrome c3 family protein [Azoarcus sp. DN11]|uniref:cytochrome c3 family protein n=1 Tax=Azoarcus sp. DN11 TaxID=356837 RepID=UPI000EB1C892|nr:cytochrome c3 family protein [Azoarcus sp. DN11]AYH42406.1 hypothetical protein CDA09_03235 [Azoarcus sp. DN11]
MIAVTRSLAGLPVAIALAATLLLAALPAGAGIVSSRHNLSVSGPGTVKAASETQVCVFCHISHNASPSEPLWNRRARTGGYTPYTSSTAKAAPGQPDGASLDCLSCHDGTIALGDLLSLSQVTAMAGGVTTMPAGRSNLGTDLSDDHPVSILYNAALATTRGELADPATLTGKVRLDASGKLQCTSCHDAHDDSNGKFLVMPNAASALCQTCHQPAQWSASSHKLSTATWNGVGASPWPHTSGTTVAANGCENCHRPHSAGGRKWLLNYAKEEDNCTNCHNGNVAAKNIKSEFTKTSIHPVATTTGVHDAAEPTVSQTRHVECADCHNPHAAKSGSAGALPGSLTAVRGVTSGGTAVEPATAEYQLCFRCHADSPGKPAARIARQIVQTNTRLEFSTSNPSYHPVAGAGKGTSVPDLMAPWTTASIIKCSDCHNNDAGPGAGGVGPNGPHGSKFAPLLERQYLTADFTTESASAYALCYKCHDRNTLLNSSTSVSSTVHRKHVVSIRTPCSACHDPHGISSTQGNVTNNSRLINWDISIVKPNSSGLLKWERTSAGHGRCYMSCHNDNHNPETY